MHPAPEDRVKRDGNIRSHAKVVGGVVGHKAVAAGTPLEQQPHMFQKGRILARPQAFDAFFEHAGAHQVGNGNGADKPKAPPPAPPAIVQRDENQDEQVKGRPKHRVAEVRQHGIEQRIGEPVVDLQEQPFVPLIQGVPERSKERRHSAKVRQGNDRVFRGYGVLKKLEGKASGLA